MAKHKYPFIPKGYYAPTMFACKIIRETGQFNRAINTSAKYYGVDKNELEKHVRARQSAGQKGKKRGKMKWFAVAWCRCRERGGIDCYEEEYATFSVKKGHSEDSIRKRMHQDDDLSEYGTWVIVDRIKECDSEQEAKAVVNEWTERRDKKFMTTMP